MRRFSFIACLACLLGPTTALAQPMDTYGMGSRSISMAGAVTADVEDYTANYYNPAGIVRSGNTRIGVGWFGAANNMSLDNVASNVDPVHGITLGLNIPGEIDGFRFGFGLAIHLPDQRISRTRSLPRARPRWELYDNRPQRTYLATHLAIQPVPWLRIGGGLAFLSYAANELRVRGVIDISAPERLSRLDTELTAELITIRYPQIGIQANPFDWLNFGVVYRGEFALDNTLVAEVGMERTEVGPNGVIIRAGSIDIPGYFFLLTQSVNAYVPHQISFAASVDPIPGLHISAEVTWLMWSRYVSPLGVTEIQLEIDVPPELRDTIMVPDTIVQGMQQEANFSDRLVPRIGIEGTAFQNDDLKFDLRLGYFYENTPVPEQTGFANLVDTDRHSWSAGIGLELRGLRPLLPGSLVFDAHFGYAWLPPRTMTKTSPIDPIGDYTAEGHIFSGGLTVEAVFE